jgi:putative phage-type endonuclease
MSEEIVQGSSQWFQMRAGHVTASQVSCVLAKQDTAKYENYRAQLVAEILTGQPQEDNYQSPDMLRGIELEPFARAAYEVKMNVLVDKHAFSKHPTIEMAGASPDGLVGDDGLIEIKCTKTAIHIQYMFDGVVPAQYRAQMIFQLACSGRKWNDFVSYNPKMDEAHQLFIVRMDRDEKAINEMNMKVIAFLQDVMLMVEKIKCL